MGRAKPCVLQAAVGEFRVRVPPISFSPDLPKRVCPASLAQAAQSLQPIRTLRLSGNLPGSVVDWESLGDLQGIASSPLGHLELDIPIHGNRRNGGRMSMRGNRWRRAMLWLWLASLAAPGCRYGTECCIDQRLAQLSMGPLDASVSGDSVAPLPSSAASSPPAPAELPGESGLQPAVPTTGQGGRIGTADSAPPATAAESPPPGLRFSVPSELPGADAPPLRLPPLAPNRPLAERRRRWRTSSRRLPSLPAESVFPLESAETALTLADLQRTALANSPVLREVGGESRSCPRRGHPGGRVP